jgi:hypothetical protein
MPVFKMRAPITTRKTFRTKPLPRLNATAVPNPAPTIFTTAIGTTSIHHMSPLHVKTQIAAAFVATFSAFAAADA